VELRLCNEDHKRQTASGFSLLLVIGEAKYSMHGGIVHLISLMWLEDVIASSSSSRRFPDVFAILVKKAKAF